MNEWEQKVWPLGNSNRSFGHHSGEGDVHTTTLLKWEDHNSMMIEPKLAETRLVGPHPKALDQRSETEKGRAKNSKRIPRDIGAKV